MKATINVTQEDIDKGVCGEALLCALARAMSRYFKRLVYVRSQTYYVVGLYHKRLPQVAIKFVCRFDNEPKSVKPFSFQIEV